jgi:hypothetical protein
VLGFRPPLPPPPTVKFPPTPPPPPPPPPPTSGLGSYYYYCKFTIPVAEIATGFTPGIIPLPRFAAAAVAFIRRLLTGLLLLLLLLLLAVVVALLFVLLGLVVLFGVGKTDVAVVAMFGAFKFTPPPVLTTTFARLGVPSTRLATFLLTFMEEDEEISG